MVAGLPVAGQVLSDPNALLDGMGEASGDCECGVPPWPCARILLEASTDSEWVARCLEGLGHEVVMADPNFAPMYATRHRKVKTDRRNARALAEACLLGAYRPGHRLSHAQRHVRGRLTVRDALVRTRTRYLSLVRALLRTGATP